MRYCYRETWCDAVIFIQEKLLTQSSGGSAPVQCQVNIREIQAVATSVISPVALIKSKQHSLLSLFNSAGRTLFRIYFQFPGGRVSSKSGHPPEVGFLQKRVWRSFIVRQVQTKEKKGANRALPYGRPHRLPAHPSVSLHRRSSPCMSEVPFRS